MHGIRNKPCVLGHERSHPTIGKTMQAKSIVRKLVQITEERIFESLTTQDH